MPKREIAEARSQSCVHRLVCSVGLAQCGKNSGWERPIASIRENLGGRYSPCFTQRCLSSTWGVTWVRFGTENFGELSLIWNVFPSRKCQLENLSVGKLESMQGKQGELPDLLETWGSVKQKKWW